MRVISGKYRGRKIESPKNKTLRPTAGVTREAIFNIVSHGEFLQNGKTFVDGSIVLDMFCGSGALGLEALSRGAKQAIFMDANAEHLAYAKKNVTNAGAINEASFIRCDSSSPPPARIKCNLVFIDPPYDSALAKPALINLLKGGWLADDAVIVVELRKKESLTVPPGYMQIDERKYGISRIIILELE